MKRTSPAATDRPVPTGDEAVTREIKPHAVADPPIDQAPGMPNLFGDLVDPWWEDRLRRTAPQG